MMANDVVYWNVVPGDHGAPHGWQKITFDPQFRPGLCHADKHWWRAPDGVLSCGTCHPAPWMDRYL